LVRHAWVTGYWQEEYGTARELADLARAHLRRRPIEGEDRIELEVLVASLEGRQEHYDAATEMLVDIQQRYARELIGNDRLSSNIYDILAWCYRRMGRTKDALAAYRQSLYFHEREWGPNQPSNAGVYAAVAVSLLDDGQVGEARGQAQWALQLAELASKPTPELAMVHSVMGDISLAQGEWAQAEAEFRRTLQIQADLYGEGYSELPYGALAKTHLKRANWQTALELLRKGIALDPSRRTLARLRQFEGDALRGLGDPSSAISAYQQALALLDEVHPKTHPRHKDVLHNLGRSYAELREYEQGVAHFERALAVGNQWPAEFSAEERHSVRFDLVRALVHLDRQRAQELGLELHRDALLLPSGYAAEVWTWLQENRLAR
jgi:tetratricopeptide (TPR) repeat protein